MLMGPPAKVVKWHIHQTAVRTTAHVGMLEAVSVFGLKVCMRCVHPASRQIRKKPNNFLPRMCG